MIECKRHSVSQVIECEKHSITNVVTSVQRPLHCEVTVILLPFKHVLRNVNMMYVDSHLDFHKTFDISIWVK